MSDENSVIATKEFVGKILELSNLKIPDYQRPYRWTEKNVVQLLSDINESRLAGKKQYLIGSIILHNNQDEKTLDIVDGQQRLSTLLLIQKICTTKETFIGNLDKNEQFNKNFGFIENWLKNIDKEKFWSYIFNNCQFVKIVVNDLSEAFQMFDSQNGRGKELEAYNLLKAYHIRAMEQNSQEEKILCDIKWEAAIQYDATPLTPNDSNLDLLKQLFTEQLFRSRIWCKKKEAIKKFGKEDIAEFKGFTVDKNHPIEFAFQNPQLLQYLTEKFYHSVLEGSIGTKSRFETGDSENINPFVNINQSIVNGKSFFEYIETYVEIYKKIFVELGSYQLSEFKEFFYKYCLTYNPAISDNELSKKLKNENSFKAIGYEPNRSGDFYLREVYKSLVFVLFDKFGEQILLQFYKPLYRIVYSARVKYRTVKYATAAKVPLEAFKIIFEATSLFDLSKIESLIEPKIQGNEKVKLDDKIVNFIIMGE